MNLLDLAFRSARAFDQRSNGTGPSPAAGDELEEAEWGEPLPPRRRSAPAREWLFWALLMCTAMVALPLIGSRWTLPDAGLHGADACGDVLLLALPAVLALPFLLLACIVELWVTRTARTPAAIASFAFALLLGCAAVPAWLA